MTELFLCAATESEKVERDSFTYDAWGVGLSLEKYLEREQRFRGEPWAARSLTTWFLKEGGAVLASCETFEMESFLGGVGRGKVLAIASVFTESARRGKGYASELLRRLPWDGAQAMILFSDVGKRIYQRVGFEAMPAYDWVFAADGNAAKVPAEHAFSLSDFAGVLDESSEAILKSAVSAGSGRGAGELAERGAGGLAERGAGALAGSGRGAGELAKQGAGGVAERGAGGLAGSGRGAGAFHILVSQDQLKWHLAREKFYLDSGMSVDLRGARIGSSAMVWMVDPKTRSLEILFFKSNSLDVARQLISYAQRAAFDFGLPQVRAWETEEFQDWKRLHSGVRESRVGHLPMIRTNPDVAWPRAGVEAWKIVSRSSWV